MSEKTPSQKRCFFKHCAHTWKLHRDKVFFCVPVKDQMRKQWFDIAKRPLKKGSRFCCEDHFDLEKDLRNYDAFKKFNKRPLLRKGIVPHRFISLHEYVKNVNTEDGWLVSNLVDLTNTAEDDLHIDESMEVEIDTPHDEIIQEDMEVNEDTSNISYPCISTHPTPQIDKTTSSTQTTRHMKRKKTKSVKVGTGKHFFKWKYRSVGLQTPWNISIVGEQVIDDASLEQALDVVSLEQSSSSTRTDHVQIPLSPTNSQFLSESSSEPSTHPETITPSTSNESLEKANMKIQSKETTLYWIKHNPKRYLGILEECKEIVPVLANEAKISEIDIYITLMKISYNDPYTRLGEQFGLTACRISQIFTKTVKVLAQYFKPLVFFPPKRDIKTNLPIPFRKHYSNTCAIIDAFEIQIQKPSNPENQGLTWSSYKHCNTLKYLVSATPDGFINFISDGFGGRISDVMLFKESKIMDKIPEGCGVMVDRGFKSIDIILKEKNCELIRPPSLPASASKKFSKDEVIKTRKIASLRIHIERVISRFREFNILRPHSTIDESLQKYVNDIVVIVAGLINLQKPLIKQE